MVLPAVRCPIQTGAGGEQESLALEGHGHSLQLMFLLSKFVA